MQLAAACILLQWKVIMVVVSLVKDSSGSPQVRGITGSTAFQV